MFISPHSLQEVFIEFTRVLQSVKASGGPKVRCSSEEGIPTPTKHEKKQQQQQQKTVTRCLISYCRSTQDGSKSEGPYIQKRIRQFIQAQIKCSWNNNEIIIDISDNCLLILFLNVRLSAQANQLQQYYTRTSLLWIAVIMHSMQALPHYAKQQTYYAIL